MSEDDKQDASTAPGSSAGDAAPTQEIPRIPKPVTSPSAKGPGGTAKKAPAKNNSSGNGASSGNAQTDKGRPRETPPKKVADADRADDKVADDKVANDTADRKRQIKAAGGPDGRTLTAADYARTTKQSPSTTAVIPAVKERIDRFKDRDKKKPGSGTTFSSAQSAGPTRRASLRLTHVEPWSVTRLAFAISVAMMIVGVVAVTIFWVVLDATGVWDQINGSVTTVLSDDSSSFNITDYLGFGRMVGLTLVLSAINVILMTALATIGAHLYNLAAQLLGGVEVTFAEEK